MDYDRLAEFYERLDATTKRLELTEILVDLLRSAQPSETQIIVYLTQGKLRPDFEGLELGIADKLVIRALTFTTGATEAAVTETYHRSGDLGDAAEEVLARSAGKDGKRKGGRPARQVTLFNVGGEEEAAAPRALTLQAVYDGLTEIARASGAGSQERKIKLLEELLLKATPRGARYLVRTVAGKLRLGIADMTVLDALAVLSAFPGETRARGVQDLTPEERERYLLAREALERAYNVSSDLGLVAKAARERGLDGLEGIRLRVGVPIRAMLAERLPTAEEILEKVGGACAVELKYDGLRLQAHIHEGGKIEFYSRRLEKVTPQFPDVAEHLRAAFRGRSAIVEGEAVAIDRDTLELRPFQEVALRRRKHGVEQAVEEIPVAVFLFDCLLLDGEDLTRRPLPERRAALEGAFATDDLVRFSDHRVVTTSEELTQYFDASVAEGAEGIMCKSVAADSAYRAGARGWQWIKFKRDYQAELTDSLDLVVVGAFVGRGRRRGWYGALLMAAYNPVEDVFETVCKLGTGFDDATLAALPPRLEPHKLDHPHARVRSNMQPDLWFAPFLVGEVRGAELTLSPIHTAAWGEVKEGAGLAVRFPRFTGAWRDDKAPEDATSTREIVEMYRAQGRRGTPPGGEEG